MRAVRFALYILLMLVAVNHTTAAIPETGFEPVIKMLQDLQKSVANQVIQMQSKIDAIAADLKSLVAFVNSLQCGQNVQDSCDQVRSKKSGVFDIRISPQETTRFYCNQEYDNGGWTVIQRRFDGSVDFYRNWTEYKRGFGNIDGGEFWLGLDRINQLTQSAPHEMAILLEDFDGNSTFAKLDRFQIAGEKDAYNVTIIDGFSGTAGDSITPIRGKKFSTFDNINDATGNTNCPSMYHGAWWYNNCYYINPNGNYSKNPTKGGTINMMTFRGFDYSLKSTTMMIRKKRM